MKKVYLDNAATTPMLPAVIEVMANTMQQHFGNPSSTHSFGRNAKAAIENARKKIATLLHCHTAEIVFTSGGTEADNLILKNAIHHLGIQHIISSSIEHHAVLNTLTYAAQQGVLVSYVTILPDGSIDLDNLERILQNNNHLKTLVSLMYVNNEIGTVLPLSIINNLKKQYGFLFHSDVVQAAGHYPINCSAQDFDFMAVAAHKFHGPKGIGFAFFKKGTGIQPEILGGEQERGSRAGTENTAAIVGMALALETVYQQLEQTHLHLQQLKKYFVSQCLEKIPNLIFNGQSDQLTNHCPAIVNIGLPKNYPMLLFQLDLKGIAVSGGSACQSGAHKGSHVLQNFLPAEIQENTALRVSFSKFSTTQEIDYFVTTLQSLVG